MSTFVHPSHVGHAVTHGAVVSQIVLGVGGLAAGAVVVWFAWPVAGAAAGVAEGAALVTGTEAATATSATALSAILKGAGVASTMEGRGMWLGKLIDTVIGDSVAGHLKSGFPTVFLGPDIKQAARADKDTQADCVGPHIGWEGSDTVSLGLKPMSRIGDRLECQAKLREGITSICVGGAPTMEGKELDESAPYVWALGIFGDFLGLVSANDGLHAVVAGAGLVLDATGSSYGDDVGHGSLIGDALHDHLIKGD